MKRADLVEAAEDTFRNSKFDVSMRCVSRPSCFDFAARRGEVKVLVKVFWNIGCASSEQVNELRRVATQLSASPLIIGYKGYRSLLEDDVVYSRYGVYVITLKTLRETLERGMHPLVEAGPGGYYVHIDGEAIRRRREELGLSMGGLAKMLGLSRITVYSYERGRVKASVKAAYQLSRVLGIPVAKPINIFHSAPSPELSQSSKTQLSSRLHQLVYRKLTQLNLFVDMVNRAPFDFIAHHWMDERRIVGGVFDGSEVDASRRASEIASLAQVVDAYPVLIVDGRFKSLQVSEVPQISHGELKRMRNHHELRERLREAVRVQV